MHSENAIISGKYKRSGAFPMKDQMMDMFVLRVSQEERVKMKEQAARLLTGCYAVYASAAAVLSALYPTDSWRVLLTLLTVLLAIMAVFLSVNPFGERLRIIRRDLSELQALNSASADGADERAVCGCLQLIMASGAGVSAQERRAYERVKDRSERWQAAREGRPYSAGRLLGYEKFLYWLNEIAGIIFMAAALLLPAAGFALAACGLL